MQELWDVFRLLLGLGKSASALTAGQVMFRAALMYLVGFVMLRFGEHRFLGKNAAFDVVLGFIFGAMLSRAINGSGPFFATLLAGVVLLTLHWLFATLSLQSRGLSRLLFGRPHLLVQDGKVQRDRLYKSRISESVLRENLRINGQLTDPAEVREAYYEPSGSISVIPKERSPRTVEVEVEEGVKTVRIELQR